MKFQTMWYVRQAKAQISLSGANVQSDQSLSSPLEYSMSVKLLTEHHLEFLSLKASEAAQARRSLHLSKCHIVGSHMLRLIC